MLIAALSIATLVSGTVLAKSKYYVPIEGKRSVYFSGIKEWEQIGTFSATYAKDGKLKKYSYKDANTSNTAEYKWKGGNLSKTTDVSTYSYEDISGSETVTSTFKIKNNKPVKMTTTFSDGTQSNQVYKWKKNKGTVTTTRPTGKSTWTVTLKKGRIYKEKYSDGSSDTCTYYRNYLLKKYSFKGKNGSSNETKYNKYGFPVSKERVGTYFTTIDGKKVTVKYSESISFKWTYKKGVPKEVVITTKRTETPGKKSSSKVKWEFTKTKQVSTLRNCDRYGLSAEIPLY